MSLFLLGTLVTSFHLVPYLRNRKSLFLLGTLVTITLHYDFGEEDQVSIPLRYISHVVQSLKNVGLETVSIPLRYISHGNQCIMSTQLLEPLFLLGTLVTDNPDRVYQAVGVVSIPLRYISHNRIPSHHDVVRFVSIPLW